MSEGMPSIITFSEDVTNAEAPKPLPAGDYPATVVGTEVKTSAKGTNYVAVQFNIAPEHFPADFADAESYPDGMKLTYNRVPAEDNPVARFRVKEFCKAIGAPTSASIDVNDWVGLQCSVTLKIEPYEGVDRNTIAKAASL